MTKKYNEYELFKAWFNEQLANRVLSLCDIDKTAIAWNARAELNKQDINRLMMMAGDKK